MEDPCEAVAALGLQAVALLCEDDVLEFYAAWRVVHKAFPKMPLQVGAAIGIVMVVQLLFEHRSWQSKSCPELLAW